MVVTLTGNNDLFLKRRLDALVSDFVNTYGELALERFDGSETNLEVVLDSILSVPFLASQKMLVLRQASANKDLADNIEQIISSVSSTTQLIIYEPATDRRTTYYKTLKANTSFEEFNEIDSKILPKWLVEEASKVGAKLTHSDAQYLIDQVGVNQAILFSELEKMASHSSVIDRQTIDLLIEKTPQSKIFDLLDAAFAGRTKKALDLYQEQRVQATEPQAMIALMVWQLHLIALVKAAKSKTDSQIAGEAKQSPYALSKARSLASRIDRAKLTALINELAEMDYQAKTSAIDLDEALKNYLLKL